MRDLFGILNSERAARISVLRETLKDHKKRVSDELGYYKSVARDVKTAKKRLDSAERAYERKESDKNSARVDDAGDEYAATVGAFNDSEAQIRQLIETVRTDYENIAELSSDRKAEKVMDEFERYSDSVNARIIDIQAYTDTDVDYESEEEEEEKPMAIPEIPVANGTPTQAAAPVQNPAPVAAPAYAAPAYTYPQYIPMPMPMYSYQPQQQAPAEQAPKVAPVSIDVSPMLEKALDATMQKFVAAFDKKIEAFVSNHPVNMQHGSAEAAVSAGSHEIAALEGLILNEEQNIIDQLNAMIENLKVISASMSELSTLCADIAVKQSTANDMQKQTNDMQRQTLRDQKGIQVGQRVIGQDQASVAQEQVALQEQQKALLENQKSLTESQIAMEESQKLVSESHAALEAAMKEAVAAQKELIVNQQAIIASNAKNVDAQNDIVEKQSATLSLQKEALAAQRQMLREQKAVVEKQKALGGDSPKKKAKPVEAVEAPATEENV